MKIDFYGTSNANPHPDRRQSGILFTIGQDHYLFDCGDGIPSALWNDSAVCLNRIHAVFFSHRHADHLGGLPALLLLLHQRIKNSSKLQPGMGIDRKLPPSTPKSNEFLIFLPGGTEQANFFAELMEIMHMADFEMAFHDRILAFQGDSQLYHDKNLQVISFPTFHCLDSSGFWITVENKTIIYSGDIQNPDVIKKVIGSKAIDLLIIENAHFPTKKISDALIGLNIKQIIVTHRKDENIANPEKVMQDLKPLEKQSKVILAEDGYSITL
jgi:Cft2 family RNA processing exonuclease